MQLSALLFFSSLFLLSFLSGCLAVVQATLNQQLGLLLSMGTLATFISFSIGLLILTALVAIEARLRALPLLHAWSAPPHPTLLLPGPLGVFFVTTSVFATLYIGFSLYFLSFVVGQLLAATVADAHGFGVKGGARLPPTPPRLLLLALALGGVLLSVLEALTGAAAQLPAAALGWCALALLTGVAALCQSVLNRAAAALLPSKLQATWWSFCLGTLLALLLFGVQAATAGSPSALAAALGARAGELRAQHFLGGLLGVAFVFCAVLVPEIIGSQAFSVALVSGQLVCSAALDAAGALGVTQRALSPLRVAGVAVVLLAAAGMQVVKGSSGGGAPLALGAEAVAEEAPGSSSSSSSRVVVREACAG
jgi:transporter family-2 protein